jgi:hypothetical protein
MLSAGGHTPEVPRAHLPVPPRNRGAARTAAPEQPDDEPVPSAVRTQRTRQPAVRRSDGDDAVAAGSVSTDGRLTVLLMSYAKSSRHHLLEAILRKALSAAWEPVVAEVILVWNGDSAAVPDRILRAAREASPGAVRDDESQAHHNVDGVEKVTAFGARLRVVAMARNRVDNRWRMARFLRTEAAMNMDDDINLSVAGATCLRNVYATLHPLTVVGIDVRSHFRHEAKPGQHGDWGYAARDLSLYSKGAVKQYSIMLPRTLVAHRRHFVAYDAAWRDDATGLKRVVDELKCDDIAFNFVVGNTSLAAPSAARRAGAAAAPLLARRGSVVYVKADYRAYGESHDKTALTHEKGMKEKRQRCVNELEGVFGAMTLQHRQWHVLCNVDG